jgi:tight adherence protein B
VSGSLAAVALAALAGGLAAVALRDAVAATPAAAGWLRRALDPLRRAGSEGHSPTPTERRRLAAVAATGLLTAGLLVAGPGAATLLAPAGPALIASVARRRRARYLRRVDEGLARTAVSVADALAAGRSLRGALGEAAGAASGPGAVELARVRADLELGAATTEALSGLRRRTDSPRVAALCAALLSQQVGGGDLAALLRRFAAAAAERDRAAADARSATAQARFTGVLVAARPAGAAVFAELLEPGFLRELLSQPAPALLVALAAALQAGGFVAISRLGRVEGHS